MPTQPIVQYQPRQNESSDKLAGAMMMEKIGSSIVGASDMLLKGVDAYQNAKIKKQGQDLAAITAAGVMVGGVDKLPNETKNKLPGILGVDLPRDDKGNVVLTPSAQDVVNRAIAKAAEADPDNFGRVKAGLQGAARDPQEVALDLEKEKTSRLGHILTAENKVKELEYNKAKDDADRAQREGANIRDNATRKLTSGPLARQEALDEPSDFWIDKRPGKTEGNTISKAAAEMTLEPGQRLEDVYWNPSHRALKEHNEGRDSLSRSKRAQSANELDKTRKKLYETRVKSAGAKDPEGMKSIMAGLVQAQKLIEEGAPDAEKVYKYWNDQFISKMGVEASEDPNDYKWMILPEYLTWAIDKGKAWLEVKTGLASDQNIPAPAGTTPTSTPGAPSTTTTTVPKPSSTTTTTPKKDLRSLLNQYRKPQ